MDRISLSSQLSSRIQKFLLNSHHNKFFADGPSSPKHLLAATENSDPIFAVNGKKQSSYHYERFL